MEPLFSRLALFLTLCFALPSYTQASNLIPLSPNETEAVIGEIKAMVKTDESQVTNFPVHEATAERIERLYSMQKFIHQQPTIIRENGLIFAGQGSLLKFDKPSDIITKISAWFPGEFATAQTADRIASIYLWGPFANWQTEPAAFMTLWNCMPQRIWQKPGQNPFSIRFSDHFPYMAIADRSSGQYDFRACIYERSGRVSARTEKDLFVLTKEKREIGNRVAPVLKDKFAHFLAENRCRGTGPDDCVLIMLLWSSLSPADPGLAKTIQMLESDVSPDGTLPALKKPLNQYDGVQDGEAHFDTGLRQSAFLRAKLMSVLHADKSWPTQALPTTLHQLTRLQQNLSITRDYRWNRYAIPNNNEVSPMHALFTDAGKSPHVRAAVLAELETLANNSSCDDLEDWFKAAWPLQTIFSLQHLMDSPPLQCANPNWTLLKQGETAEMQKLRSKYLGLLGQNETGKVHELLLSELTDNGNSCFDKNGGPSRDWLHDTCMKWVSEPLTVPFALKHSSLTLDDENKFRPTTLQMPTATPTTRPDTTTWLTKLVQGMSDEGQQKMQTYVADLKLRDVSISVATRWDHPRQDRALIELHLSKSDLPENEPGWSNRGVRKLIVVEPHTISLVDIPARFRGYDDYAKIVNVSDLDNDGNIEVWWAESFRTCNGDETDLKREMDCSIRMANMGEIMGDSLTYFTNTPTMNKTPVQHKTLPSTSYLATAVTPNPLDDQRSCNTVLIGTVLEAKLGINFKTRAKDGDLIALVCKAHPLHPEQTIVALFHDLKDIQGNLAAEQKKGFVLAVIDAKQHELLSLYRSTIEEDATTRIDDFSLQIDTARYNLAPGVRALGVRMNIGYSPKCAEGGVSNYLTLFIAEGKQLKPVLKDLPMSFWTITEGSNGCGADDAAYTMDSAELTIAISPTITNGWHDLEISAVHPVDAMSGAKDIPIKQPARSHVLGKLQANGKIYPGNYGWVRSRLGAGW